MSPTYSVLGITGDPLSLSFFIFTVSQLMMVIGEKGLKGNEENVWSLVAGWLLLT